MHPDEGHAADDLERYLDDLAFGRRLDAPAVDPDYATIAARLHALSTALPADQGFVNRLEENLMSVPTPSSPSLSQPIGPSLNGRQPIANQQWTVTGSRSRFWPLSELPTVAALLLILLLGFVAIRLARTGGNDERPAGIAVATPAASPPVACEGPARTAADFALLSGTPSAWGLQPVSEGRGRTAILADHLPAGEPADPTTVAAIEATVHRYWACATAGDAERLAGLYSEDYWRRAIQVLGTPTAWEFDLTPQPDWTFHPPVVRDARVLPNGRVGAIVVTIGENGTMEESFAIFVETEGGWLIDEILAMVDPSAAAWPDPAACRVNPRPAATPIADTSRQLHADDLLATEEASHGPLPPDSPVSDATTLDISDVWHELWACLAADDPSRVAALFTDDGLASLPAGFGALGQYLGLEVSNRHVELDEDRTPYPALLHDILLVEDGRIVAVFAPYAPWAVEYRIFFEVVDGRWMIDGVYRFTG